MTDSDHSASLVQSASDAYKCGDHVRALALCNEAISISPSNLKGKLIRALVNQATQNHSEAINELTEILAKSHRGPFTVPALYSRARSNSAIAQSRQAANDCATILEIDPNHHDARFLYCVALKALDEIEQAFVEATQLIEARPDYHEAIYTRATIRHMMADWSGAVEDFTAYLKNAESSPEFQHDAYFLRGFGYHHLNSNETALADLNHALTLEPNNATTLARRSLEYSELGRAEESKADIERCKELLDGDAR